MTLEEKTKASATAIRTYADHAEEVHKIMKGMTDERARDESPDYWRGADDAMEFFIADIRSYADRLELVGMIL